MAMTDLEVTKLVSHSRLASLGQVLLYLFDCGRQVRLRDRESGIDHDSPLCSRYYVPVLLRAASPLSFLSTNPTDPSPTSLLEILPTFSRLQDSVDLNLHLPDLSRQLTESLTAQTLGPLEKGSRGHVGISGYMRVYPSWPDNTYLSIRVVGRPSAFTIQPTRDRARTFCAYQPTTTTVRVESSLNAEDVGRSPRDD